MDNELRLIQYLYGEEERPEEIDQLLSVDDALHAEYRRLHAVKKQLDARTAQRPDPAVIDRIVDAAAPAAQPASSAPRPARQREDREPAAPPRMPWQRILRVTAALAVLLIGVSVGVWQWDGGVGNPLTAGNPATESQSAADGQARTSPADDASIPDWDEADDVVRLHRHIETLQARSSPTSWDYPGAELQTAGQVRPSGN